MRKGDFNYEKFIEECNNAFGFLITEYGFSQPVVDFGHETNFLFVTYYKKKVAIECIFDEREDDVSVEIIKLVDGKKTGVYRTDDKGEVFGESLIQLLIHRGVRGFGLQTTTGDYSHLPKQQSEFRKILSAHARLIRKHCPDILEGSAQIFEALRGDGSQ